MSDGMKMRITFLLLAILTYVSANATTTPEPSAEDEVVYEIIGVTERENAKTVSIPITRSQNTGVARLLFTVSKTVANTNPAVSPVSLKKLFFKNGEDTAYINIVLTDDEIAESDEEYEIKISDPSVGTIKTDKATLRVLDDDEWEDTTDTTSH